MAYNLKDDDVLYTNCMKKTHNGDAPCLSVRSWYCASQTV